MKVPKCKSEFNASLHYLIPLSIFTSGVLHMQQQNPYILNMVFVQYIFYPSSKQRVPLVIYILYNMLHVVYSIWYCRLTKDVQKITKYKKGMFVLYKSPFDFFQILHSMKFANTPTTNMMKLHFFEIIMMVNGDREAGVMELILHVAYTHILFFAK